ncbi:hypothetical protein [Flavobacterium suzhouense]|uniref:Lipoprotein n=1 Tax=Flavobacterium suzhouense TaxID=1529638 RepID=A0ABW5NSH2_9FLAO
MRKIFLLYVLFAFLSSCDKNDDKNCSGADCLPPATQTGADTFGCLVNGEPFVDKSRSFNCFYQFFDGEYYFSISAKFNKSIKGIGLGSQKIELLQAGSYQLREIGAGNFSADVFVDADNNFETSLIDTGTISITKFDMEKKIVSATFEFTVTDPASGKVYKITEGRFDTHFTE